jgi:succinate dehydrogenase/fumarate reductase-like Fe-S protein
MNEPRTVLLKVFRHGPADTAPRYDEFRVPVGPRTTVLDALLAVRHRQDPSLTVRHSCLHGSCGTCGMRVNGRVDDAHGAWRCHLAFECSEVCPAGVDPAGAIMRLRRRLLRDRLPRLVGRYDREVRT